MTTLTGSRVVYLTVVSGFEWFSNHTLLANHVTVVTSWLDYPGGPGITLDVTAGRVNSLPQGRQLTTWQFTTKKD